MEKLSKPLNKLLHFTDVVMQLCLAFLVIFLHTFWPFIIIRQVFYLYSFQCFDTVVWATGIVSSL